MRRGNVRDRPHGGARGYIGFLAVLVAMALAPGCAEINTALAKKAYKGPALAKDEIALILPRGSVEIAKIDGHGCYQRYYGFRYDVQMEDCQPGAEMRPGEHDIVLEGASLQLGLGVSIPANAAAVTLSLDAKAGHRYLAHSDWSNEQAWFWIVDAATGDVVAGTKPSADK